MSFKPSETAKKSSFYSKILNRYSEIGFFLFLNYAAIIYKVGF